MAATATAATVNKVEQVATIRDNGDPKLRRVAGVEEKGHPVDSAIKQGLRLVQKHNAETLAARRERLAKESTTVWVSPFDIGKANRQTFATKAKCNAYMKKEQSARIEQAKLTKQPKAMYQPRAVVVPPKARAEDFMSPAQAADHARQEKTKKGPARPAAKLKPESLTTLIMKPVYLLREKLASSTVEELQEIGNKAWVMGRQELSRACRKELKDRGAKANWI